MKVNVALVPVVVRDKEDRAVGNLKKEDFRVFDKDKPTEISGFSIEKRAAIEASGPPGVSAASDPKSAVQPVPPPSVTSRFIVFVFDNLHISAGDLMRTQQAAAKMLSESLSDGDLAAVVSLSGTNSGFTNDRTKLQEAVKQIRMEQLLRHDEHECPNIDYYQADLIQNKHSQTALELAEADFATCAHLQGPPPHLVETMVRTAASKSLLQGEHDTTVSLDAIGELVTKMGTLPGQRTLILISPGFLTVTGEAMIEKSKILDLAARSDVMISALDARGLYTTGMDASERGGSSKQDMLTGQHAQNHAEVMNLNEDVMAELAIGTGGTYFHNNNDLEAGFKTLAQAPEYVYLLELPLDKMKPDGTYHPLKVKVDRDGVKVQARRGYYAAKAESTAAPATRQTLTVPTAPGPTAPEAPAPATSETPAASPPSTTVEAPSNPQPPPALESSATPPVKNREKRPKNDSLFWYPIDVDAPLRDYSSTACPMSNALQIAGARADEMAGNLQDFTAEEQVEYHVIEPMNTALPTVTGTYNYSVFLKQAGQGLAVQESRAPQRGSQPLPPGAQDVGLPHIALLFLSSFQADYEMKCEGAAEWNGRPVWVVHFQQLPNRPSHTAVFSVKGVAYPAKLKGRAWIIQGSNLDSDADSGQVIHLELSLMDAISAAKVRKMYVRIDYGPVQFRTQNVKFWLPQDVTSYGDFGDHRTIVHHTFSNFLLFSVQTDQVTEKPKSP